MDGVYKVLATDYTSYSITYACVEYMFGMFHTPMLTIMTRDQVVSDTTKTTIYNKVTQNLHGIDWLML